MKGKSLAQNLAVYGVALGIIWFLTRDIPFDQLWRQLELANLWIFLPAAIGSFLIWFLGETLLYSKLFTYFQAHIGFREMLPVNGAQYFLQLVNLLVAGSTLILYMFRRKGVPWLAGGWTLMLQGLIDFTVLALMVLLAAPLVPGSPVHPGWFYALPALIPLLFCMWFWMRGRPTLGVARWLYDRPSLSSFRQARPTHYAKLGGMRAGIFVGQAFMLYFEMRAFGVHAPLSQILAFEPVVLFFGGLPITPVGLGMLPLVLIIGFHAFASKAALLAMALSISFVNMAFRIPLGFGSARVFIKEVCKGRTQTEPNGESSLLNPNSAALAFAELRSQNAPVSCASPSASAIWLERIVLTVQDRVWSPMKELLAVYTPLCLLGRFLLSAAGATGRSQKLPN